MALSASLALDIRKFEDGCKKAVVEMQTVERASKTVNRDLKRLMEDFSGQKVAVEAQRMAEAVTRIGGASKLTESEQRRVNASVTEAIAKYQALGQTAPAHLVSLQQATAKAATGTSSLLGVVGQMAAAFSVAGLISKGASALVSFGVASLDGASKLVDLNKATHVSIEALQRWSHIADQGGIALEDLTTSSFKLGAAIDGGGSGVRGAVERLGLAWDKIRAQKPEDQMNAILSAAEALGPSQERNAILVELFGNRGAQALARVVEGWKETGIAASVAGDEQVKALDRAADRWSKFLKDLGTGFTQTMGRVVSELENLDDAAGGANRQGFIGGGEFDPLLAAADDVRQAAERSAASRKTDIALTNDSVVATKNYVAELAKLQQQINEVVKVRGEELAAAVKVNTSTEEITRAFGLSEEAQRLYASSTKETISGLKSADDFTASWNNSLSENARKIAEAAVEAKRFIDALNTKVQFGGDTMKDMTGLLESRFTGPIAAALLANAKAHAQYQREMDVLTEGRTMTRVNVEIAQIRRWATAQKASLDKTDGAWRENAAAIDAIANSRIDQIVDDDLIAQMVLFANKTTEATARLKELKRAAAQDFANGLRDLSSAFADLAQSTGGLDKTTAKIAELIGLMGTSASAGIQMRDGLAELGKEGGNAAAGFVQLAAGALAAAAAMKKATSSGSDFEKIMGGITTGFAAGGLLGAAFGGIIGWMQTTKIEAKGIAGLIEDWPAKFKESTDEAGHLSKQMVDMLVHMREVGIIVKEVTDYMREQSSAALAAFNAVAAGTARWQEFGDAVKKAAEAGDKDALTEALKSQHAAAEAAGPALKDLGIQAMAAFNAALASGMSYTEALRQIQPGIQAIIKAHQDLGINIDDAALAALAMQSNLLAKNPEILAGLDGLAQGMLALSNIGLMNADTFAAMQRTAMDMFTRIQGEVAAMGGSQRDALLPMQQYLREAAEQARLLGIPLDENTQMLIDQSKELGIWKDKAVDPMEQIRDVAVEIRDAVREMAEAFKRVPSRVDTQVNTRYTSEGTPPGGTPGGGDASGTGDTGGGSGRTGGSRGGRGIQDPNADYRVEPGAASAATGGVMPPVDIHVTVQTDIDGRQAAEAIVVHIPDALSRRGL